MEFEITLKNEKLKSYRMMAWINILLNVAVFGFLSMYDAYRLIGLSALMAFGLYLLLRWYVYKNQKAPHFFDEFAFFIPAMCWFGLHTYVLMILLILIGVLYRFSLQPVTFRFSADTVQKMNFPKKMYSWNSFSNIILKDQVLTLDLKTNKLIQSEIEKPKELTEAQFNEFAQERMRLSESKIQAGQA
jgi:hypothetical protein